jgi:hypothetical protein
MTKLLSVLTVVAALSGTTYGGTIQGTILDLKGDPLKKLDNFKVTAEVAGTILASGKLTTISAPFRYEIDIPNVDLNPNDIRVILKYRAVGRDPVDLLDIPGNVNQEISVVMPVAHCQQYCVTCGRRRCR